MPSIAITGGIACGKSYTADFLANKLNITAFNSDQEISDLLNNDPVVALEIRNTFGNDVFDSPQKLNRAQLRSLIINSPQNKKALENILHSRIRKKWLPQAIAALKKNSSFFLAEIPLLYENNLASFFDYVIVVAASTNIQRKRLIEQRNLSYHTASSLIELQQRLSKKIEAADYIIWNDGEKNIMDQQLSLLASIFSI